MALCQNNDELVMLAFAMRFMCCIDFVNEPLPCEHALLCLAA